MKVSSLPVMLVHIDVFFYTSIFKMCLAIAEPITSGTWSMAVL